MTEFSLEAQTPAHPECTTFEMKKAKKPRLDAPCVSPKSSDQQSSGLGKKEKRPAATFRFESIDEDRLSQERCFTVVETLLAKQEEREYVERQLVFRNGADYDGLSLEQRRMAANGVVADPSARSAFTFDQPARQRKERVSPAPKRSVSTFIPMPRIPQERAHKSVGKLICAMAADEKQILEDEYRSWKNGDRFPLIDRIPAWESKIIEVLLDLSRLDETIGKSKGETRRAFYDNLIVPRSLASFDKERLWRAIVKHEHIGGLDSCVFTNCNRPVHSTCLCNTHLRTFIRIKTKMVAR